MRGGMDASKSQMTSCTRRSNQNHPEKNRKRWAARGDGGSGEMQAAADSHSGEWMEGKVRYKNVSSQNPENVLQYVVRFCWILSFDQIY